MAVTSLGPDRDSGSHSIFPAVLRDSRRTLAVLAVLVLASIVIQFATPVNHDAAWYLHSAEALLAGGELYNDIYLDMNLPLPLFLAMPPVLLSEATGLFVVHAFRIYVFAWMLFSCWLAWRLLDGLVPEFTRRGLMIFVLAAVFLLPMDRFGQREHFLIFAILPYLILIARRASGLPFKAVGAASIGFQAALGFALKPHFLLVVAALEAYLLWRNRSPLKLIRPEILSLGATGLSYLLVVVLYAPAFFTLIAPMALDLYHGFNRPLLDVILVVPLPILAFALFVHLKGRHALDEAALPDVLCLSALCFFTIYAVQMKGWPYQLYPAVACLILLLGAILFGVGRSNEPSTETVGNGAKMRKSIARSAIVASLILLGSAAAQGFAAVRDQSAYLTHMVPALSRHAENSSFLFLTTNLSASFPLTHYSGVRFVSRFPMLWPVAGLQKYRRESSESLSPDNRLRLETYEEFLIGAVVADLMRWKPKVVIVDERPQKPYINDQASGEPDLDKTLNFIHFLSVDPRFARLWGDYQVVDRLGYFTIFARR